MKIDNGILTLHEGESLENCVRTISYIIGEDLMNSHGHVDHLSLCDQIARDNGYHDGLYDPSLANLSTSVENNPDPITFFLPEWVSRLVNNP
ncbi:MAG: hypothetical protein ACD_62C00053G0002 [uncultured bacterium]|nr:MAG: hypothetical protein ACD_62C00053G0002 [uncultured bacterium]